MFQVFSGVRTFDMTGFDIRLTRILRPYVYNVYVPTAILVVASWISFFIPVNLVPGRCGRSFM